LLGIAPRGPLSLPPGGAHWYRVKQVGYPDEATFDPTYALVAPWLDATLEGAGIPPERAVIGGFSQGGVMTYSLGLGPGRPGYAGLIALSSFVPRIEAFELELHRARGLRVAIGHGIHDPVIGIEWGRDPQAARPVEL